MHYLSRFYHHFQQVIGAWRRVLLLIWQLNPRAVSLLIFFTVVTGLLPPVQIQLTTLIVQSAINAFDATTPQAVGSPPRGSHLAHRDY